MKIPFDRYGGLIIVSAQVSGPTGRTMLKMALDTGATRTLISKKRLEFVGYDLAAVEAQARMTTGSGVVSAPIADVELLEALAVQQSNLPCICHNLPPTAGVDGLIGLDFLRDLKLTIDFRAGWLELT